MNNEKVVIDRDDARYILGEVNDKELSELLRDNDLPLYGDNILIIGEALARILARS